MPRILVLILQSCADELQLLSCSLSKYSYYNDKYTTIFTLGIGSLMFCRKYFVQLGPPYAAMLMVFS